MLSFRPVATNPITSDSYFRLQLFRGVEMGDVVPTLNNCAVRELQTGDVLLTPQETNNNFYIILEGRLLVHLDSLQNASVTSLEPGECAGELSIFDKGYPSAFVVAPEPTRLLVLPADALWNLITISHKVALNLLYIMSKRVRNSNLSIASSEHLANIDPLTGLHNRRWFEEVFGQELRRSDRTGKALCLAMIDIDRFKNYNDKRGHPAGDLALCVVADALRKNLRPADMLARFGGEEFIVMLPETSVKKALAIANRLRTATAERKIHDEALGDLPSVTISIGVAERQAGTSLDDLIALADSALYDAKEAGRNRICHRPPE
jgi:diguanylate cyclase (GGDEF)-like protein